MGASVWKRQTVAGPRWRGFEGPGRLAHQQSCRISDGTALLSHLFGHIVEHAGKHTARRPGETQRADFRRCRQRRVLLRSIWHSRRLLSRASAMRDINLLRGPGVVSCDAGLNRDFVFTERFKLQFRGEAFNVLNTPHLALPGTNVSNMVLNNDGSIRNLAGYSQI